MTLNFDYLEDSINFSNFSVSSSKFLLNLFFDKLALIIPVSTFFSFKINSCKKAKPSSGLALTITLGAKDNPFFNTNFSSFEKRVSSKLI